MRTYIFTNAERKAIQLFLEGKIKSGDARVAHILSRVRSFVDLAKDVDRYLALRRLAESKTA